MENFTTALIVSSTAARRHVLSALPDAPVVPDAPPRRSRVVRPTRAALARGLERLAGAVAPAPVPTCRPAG